MYTHHGGVWPWRLRPALRHNSCTMAADSSSLPSISSRRPIASNERSWSSAAANLRRPVARCLLAASCSQPSSSNRPLPPPRPTLSSLPTTCASRGPQPHHAFLLALVPLQVKSGVAPSPLRPGLALPPAPRSCSVVCSSIARSSTCMQPARMHLTS